MIKHAFIYGLALILLAIHAAGKYSTIYIVMGMVTMSLVLELITLITKWISGPEDDN